MEIKLGSVFMIVLAVFLLNSAGLFSPTLSMRGEDWELARSVSSNTINRLVMLSSFIFGIGVIFRTEVYRLRWAIVKSWPVWLLFLFALLSILWSDLRSVSVVRLLQQLFLFVFLLAISITLDSKRIYHVLIFTVLVLVAVGFFCLVIPGAWQDIGYRSIHGHKNTAGYLYALSAIILFYHVHSNDYRNRFFIFALLVSIVLLVLTRSKTSMILSLVSILSIVSLAKFSSQILYRTVLFVWLFSCVAFISLLVVPIDTLHEIGLNLTGRLVIWDFAISELQGRELFGVGYRAFWGVGETGISVLYGNEYDGFITQLNQAHNSYLDIWVMLGWIGVLVFSIFVVNSFSVISKFNILYFSILLFLTIHSFLETDFFRSNNYLWVMYTLIYFSSMRLHEVESEK